MTAHRRIFPNPRRNKIERFQEFKDSVSIFSIDTSLLDQEHGDATTGVTWSTEDTSIISLGTSSFASGVGSIPITMSEAGKAKLKMTIATDGNSAPVLYIYIHVKDPEYDTNDNWV